jgi:hypothetical protein
MSDKVDELLARELGKLSSAATETSLGAADLPLGGWFGRLTGFLNRKVSEKFLPTVRFEKTIELKSPPEAVFQRLADFFSKKGRLLEEGEVGESPHPTLSAVIGSGFFNLNPTVVHARVVAATAEGCTLVLAAAAKEGLIKQKSAQKAVNRLAALLEGP